VISIPADTLHHMLTQVTPHMAAENSGLPSIECVHLEAADGYLHAVATDRYTMAVARRAASTSTPWAAGVAAHDVPTLTTWLAATPGIVAVGDDADHLALTAGARTLHLPAAVPPVGRFPDWPRHVVQALRADPEPGSTPGWTTTYLARWQHAAPVLAAWHPGPGSPLVLADEDGEFLGLQMPCRLGAEARDRIIDGWLAHLTPTATHYGRTYDLTRTWRDRDGDPWTWTGRARHGEPLMRLGGIDGDDQPLPDVIRDHGPLTASPKETC
jgi:hypothetical protein